ncbi:hypothetical protein NKH18_32165 [Streptomyces sp. M10(2022)]
MRDQDHVGAGGRGAAPSRVPCSASAQSSSAQALETVPVQIYLVCASQLLAVDRTVRLDESEADRVQVARSVLGELQQEPTDDERRAGFSTDVPADLRVSDALPGDREGTLRLSEQPEDLPAEALAQVVCSYAESKVLTSADAVVLGGPGSYPPRSYLCTSETKSRPGNVPTLGAIELP